ncbi:2,3-diaminopropionate biosynthesis protein SbnB [Methylobacterium haplocladii]|uniref:2,3-diaminopropionate biosynthesis protein SbnB n=1 Tax=Methylobacterium haplocladii TaxID=1176176 RepID=A0A512INV3_9HYPH|nr:2,3-diaminopropionate biosynthesis protein SbnB [Methylobacterium haplocladii]GEO99318.1 2,3-diaminopropionate biosynthesis protein SbnB [Methylobacterium haplocladii]GJD83481.1 N-((2S)-2-amino-2-carboxyethyl)-L-glutamate dehydrogenase [Methylobacterium haplocladii]GLS61206.1 2,3-diaminopropionate biosynthesis protein SbnB [Methylobacterium haplocladii]
MTAPTLRYLSRSDIAALGGDHSDLYMAAIEHGLRLHAAGEFVQPLKPYLRNPRGCHIADRIIAMPAWIGGDHPISGLKWIGSKHDNPSARGLERASAVMVLNDAETNFPVAIMEAGLISAMRTAAVTGVAVRHLAKSGFTDASIVGCGPIGERQARMLAEQFPTLETLRLFDLRREAAEDLSSRLRDRFPRLRIAIAETAEAAVRDASVVVTCTVTDTPYLPFSWLSRGTFLANVSIMDVESEVFLKSDKVVVDDWDQSNREKKVINLLVESGQFSRETLHAELGEIVVGRKPGRESDDEIILLNPMGMAIDDVACAAAILRLAEAKGAGTLLPLY